MNNIIPPPKDRLLGKTVGSGWCIVEVMTRPEGATGGNFSTGYIVERNGIRAFLKAMDLTSALLKPADQQLNALARVVESIQFEGMLLQRCTDHGLTRVIRLIEQAVVESTPSLGNSLLDATERVHVFIFELGGADVRRTFGAPKAEDARPRLSVLHDVAVAVQQLHRAGIAHQDIKPSNILEDSGGRHKIADLGRASLVGVTGPSDDFLFPGDLAYSPPEFEYGHIPEDATNRRFAADAYLIGSMISFMFTLQGTTTLLQQALPRHVLPPRWQRDASIAAWQGSYEDALPHLEQSMNQVRTYIEPYLPSFCRTELSQAFAELCDPNPYRRGHPKARASTARSPGVDRYVSLFDRLVKQANVSERSSLSRPQ
jgi:eukaryotic-like serine/threonine-protein kinase